MARPCPTAVATRDLPVLLLLPFRLMAKTKHSKWQKRAGNVVVTAIVVVVVGVVVEGGLHY